MNDRKNLLALLEYRDYERMPIDYNFAPVLKNNYKNYCKKMGYKTPSTPFSYVAPSAVEYKIDSTQASALYKTKLLDDTTFDSYGVAMEAGSESCMHLRKFYHPLQDASTLEEIEAFPFLKLKRGATFLQKNCAFWGKLFGKFVMGSMQCTIWEQSWYIRGMENMMMDMLCEPELAEAVLDKVTENSIINAENYALAGADGIFLGDDIGMQASTIMSEELYCQFIKPRLKKVIDAVRVINPKIKVFYHSCGYIEPFIPHLIEVGVDVLNPMQPECMDIFKVYNQYKKRIAFMGGIGTQSTMPFGTAEDVKNKVKEIYNNCAKSSGFMICPTHILEPEVPPENIVAYFESCKTLRK